MQERKNKKVDLTKCEYGTGFLSTLSKIESFTIFNGAKH